MLLGLGWPQWLTIILLVGGLILTFKMMAKASVAYEKARKAREAQDEQAQEDVRPADRLDDLPGEKEET